MLYFWTSEWVYHYPSEGQEAFFCLLEAKRVISLPLVGDQVLLEVTYDMS